MYESPAVRPLYFAYQGEGRKPKIAHWWRYSHFLGLPLQEGLDFLRGKYKIFTF
jgi:hypothetical protein